MLKYITFINMANINKNDIISKIYYDKSGYGSITTTYKDAKQKEQSITLNDVKEWFQKNIEQKKQLRGKNSFIAPHPYFEFQLDLFFINDIPNQKFKVGMVLIDIFTRYSTVIPIKSKQPPDILAGVMEGMQKMKGKPEIIYSDEEGSLYKKQLKIISKKREQSSTAQEDILILPNVLYAPTKICYIKGLKKMKRRKGQYTMDRL